MSLPPVVVRLDPSDLADDVRRMAPWLWEAGPEAQIVLVLSGIDVPSSEQAAVVEAALHECVDRATLDRIGLAGETYAAGLARVAPAPRPSGAPGVPVPAASRERGPAGEARSATSDQVRSWTHDRDALIDQRDAMTPAGAGTLVVGVVRTSLGLTTLEPVLRAVQSQGARVAIVDVRANDPANEGACDPTLPVESISWFQARFDGADEGPLIVLYSDYASTGCPPEVSATTAAEYGVRVAYVCAASELGQDEPEDKAFDTDAFRVAWRIYVASERQERLIARHCAVGASAVRKAGTPMVDRLSRATASTTAEQRRCDETQTVILWHPEAARVSGPDDPRVHLAEMKQMVTQRPNLRMLLNPPAWLPRDPARADRWRATLDQLVRTPGFEIDWSTDAYEPLLAVDALITSANGPVVEMMQRDRPCLYLHRVRASLDTGAEVNLACAIALEWDDVERFIDDVVVGRDPGRAARRVGLARFCEHEGSDAVARIRDDLVYTLWLERMTHHDEVVQDLWPAVQPLLSVALIVKDEERNIEACLDSLACLGDAVGEVVVYDTGSTDRTVELAASRDAIVERGYWDHDFARARNDAVRLCRGRWVMMVDADDRVRGDQAALVKALAFGLTLSGPQSPVVCLTVEDVRKGGVVTQVYPVPRLLRPDLAHWVGRIHEEPHRIDGRGFPFVRLDAGEVVLATHGYEDQDEVRRKTLRNLEIAEMEVLAAEQTQDVDRLIHGLVDRARSGLMHGREEEALADFERVRYLPSEFLYRVWGVEQYAALLLDRGMIEQAAEVIDQLRREHGHPSQIEWLDVRLLALRGNTREALEKVRGIATVVSALASEQRPSQILEARLRLAVQEAEFDEALAVLLNLMAGHGVVEGRVPLLLRLWEGRGRSLDSLGAQLITADGGYLAAVIEELESSAAPGPAIAAQIRTQLAEV